MEQYFCMEQKLLKIGGIVAGIIFLFSGIGKMLNTLNFAILIGNYGFHYLFFLSPVIVITEITIGLLLLFGYKLRKTAIIASILTLLFTIAFIYANQAKGVADCGCFGVIKPLNFTPTITILRNVFIILLLTLIIFKYKQVNDNLKKWQLYISYFIIGISIFVAGFTFSPPSATNTPKQHPFYHKAIKDTELKNIIQAQKDSNYLIFYFSYDCAHCWNSIENLKPYLKKEVVDTLVLYANGSEEEKNIFNQSFNISYTITSLPKDSIIPFIYYYPTAFFIHNDSVKNIIEGVLPSANTYKKYYLQKN